MVKCVRAITPAVAAVCLLTGCGASSKTTTQQSSTSQPPVSSSTSSRTRVTEATAPPTFQIATPQGTFTVTSTDLMVGGRVTLSGTGCKSPDLILAAVGSGPQAYGTTAQVPTKPDGTWRVTTPVENSTLLGARRANAQCVEPVHHSGVFAYSPVAVKIATFRRVRVDRTSVEPGATLLVTPTATCTGGGEVAEVDLLPARDPMPDGMVTMPGTSDVTTDAAGNWSARVVIPANMPSGAYNVDAACGAGREGVDAFYEPVPITVT